MWPRSGGDRGNRSAIEVAGPTRMRVVERIALSAPAASPDARRDVAGGATCRDGSLRVTLRGVLFAIDVDARAIRWSLDLRTNEADDAPLCSLPTLLADDAVVLTAHGDVAEIDARGVLRRRVEVPMADDSGHALNVTLDGRPILTSITGEIYLLGEAGLTAIPDRYGYDIVPVAVYDDGTFGVAGYYGTGYCRTSEAGLVWKSGLRQADLLPTVNRAQHSAVGSANETCSAIFDPAGQRIATYPRAAVFAEYVDGDWIARSDDHIARLSATGEVRWERDLRATRTLGGNAQPLVDGSGRIYAIGGHEAFSLDGDGATIASLALDTTPSPLIPIRAGLFGTIVGDEILLVDYSGSSHGAWR